MNNRPIAKRIGSSSLMASIVLIAWLLLPVRVANPELNQIVTLLSFWAVLIGLAIACACLPNRTWIRILGALPFSLLALAFPVLIFLSMVGGGPISGYEILDSVKLDHSTVIAYRTNGGATTDYGITIVQEMPVVAGIVLAKDLHSGYHEYAAILKVTGPDSILAIIDNNPKEFRVRPFIYF
jgi:hypothetical protein